MKSILINVKLLAAFFLIIGSSVELSAQGCVAIRTVGGLNTMEHSMMHGTMNGMMHDGNDSNAQKMVEPKWDLNINGRYFKSYKHFVGTQEQKQRETDGSNVINNAFEMNVNATRVFNTRNSISISVPFLSYKRSSLYEHDGKNRQQTHSFGLGDIRVAANRWMLDPNKSPKTNFQIGLGIKLPTGNYNSQDYYNKLNKNLSLVPKMSSSNIYEIIEMPPINYMGATYEISIWTNFQQEANRIFDGSKKRYFRVC